MISSEANCAPQITFSLHREGFSAGTLGPLKIKKRSKSGPNVNRKHLYKLLTDVEPEINVTVYIFHVTDGDKRQLFFFETSGAICNIITIFP